MDSKNVNTLDRESKPGRISLFVLCFLYLCVTCLIYCCVHFGLQFLYTTGLNFCPSHNSHSQYILKASKILQYTTPHHIHCTTPYYTKLYYTITHYTTLPFTKLHYIRTHYTISIHSTVHYTTLHYTTILHYTTLHYTTLYYTTPHHTTPNYTQSSKLMIVWLSRTTKNVLGQPNNAQ